MMPLRADMPCRDRQFQTWLCFAGVDQCGTQDDLVRVATTLTSCGLSTLLLAVRAPMKPAFLWVAADTIGMGIFFHVASLWRDWMRVQCEVIQICKVRRHL